MRLRQYLNESINDKGILKAVFMAGHPGSGKSYVLNQVKFGGLPIRIFNTDLWTELFKAYDRKVWAAYSPKIKHLAKAQLANTINSMLPVFIDGTSGSAMGVRRRKNIMDSFGYDTAMIWVNTSLETALARAEKRERVVPPEFIEQSHAALTKLKPYYKSLFDTFIEVNNDEGELTDKMIIKAFNKANSFWNSPVKNTLGKQHIEKMREEGWKYYDDGIIKLDHIKNILGAWYRV